MTVIATASNPRFSVSRIEVDRPGETYTLDTLRHLHRDLQDRYPAGIQLFFITGADALAQITTWHAAAELFALAHFIGVTRPGHRLADPGFPAGGVSLLEIPAMAISSTDCRARVESGLPIWYLVPDGVVQYITKTGCYAPAGAGTRGTIAASDLS